MNTEMKNKKLDNLKTKYVALVKERKIKELMETGNLTGELNMKYIDEINLDTLINEFMKSGNLIKDTENLIKELDDEIPNLQISNSTKQKDLLIKLEAVLKKYFVEPELSDDEKNKALAAYDKSLQPKTTNVNSSTSNKSKGYMGKIKNSSKALANRLFKRGGGMSRKTKKSKKRRTNRK